MINENKIYRVFYTKIKPDFQGLWDNGVWRDVVPLAINCHRPEGSDHRPRTRCKLLFDEQNLYGIFCVEDQYVRCSRREFQSDVWKDSCVEIFIRPEGSLGYFNFEFNCGGTLLSSYVTSPERVNGKIRSFTPLVDEDDQKIRRFASQPPMVDPEIDTPVTWFLEFSIPLDVLEKYTGRLGDIRGQIWHANFYKCGNETSHPHWVSWMPLSARNFHEPESFGTLVF